MSCHSDAVVNRQRSPRCSMQQLFHGTKPCPVRQSSYIVAINPMCMPHTGGMPLRLVERILPVKDVNELKRRPRGRKVTHMPMKSPRLFDPLRFVAPTTMAKPRETLVAEAAYLRAERRGFEPGHERED